MGANGLLVVAVFLVAAGQLLMKLGVQRIGPLDFSRGIKFLIVRIIEAPPIWGGVAVYGLSAFVWILVLSKVELSYAYPMMASGYILVSLLAWGLFHEEMTAMKGVALAVIGVGVVLLGWSQTR